MGAYRKAKYQGMSEYDATAYARSVSGRTQFDYG